MESPEEQTAHLEGLATELRQRGFTAEVTAMVPKPYLKVANASTPELNERVHCQQCPDDSWSFWWPWGRPIGPVDDLEAVVSKIAAALRSVDGTGQVSS